MSDQNHPDIFLDITSTLFSKDKDDPYDSSPFFNSFSYNAFISPDEDDISFFDPILIGRGNVCLYKMTKAFDAQYDILDAFEQNCQEEYWKIIFEKDVLSQTQRLKPFWQEILHKYEIIPNNILIQERLQILPEFRHKQYGQIICDILREFFSDNYCIELIKSFPLQFEDPFIHKQEDEFSVHMKYADLESDENNAFRKLNDYYHQCGYIRIDESQYFYRLPFPG